MGPGPAAESLSAAARAAALERPIAVPLSAPPLAATLSDLEQGGVSVDDVHGVSVNDQASGGEVLGDDVVESEVGEARINIGGVSETQEGMSEEEEEIQTEETGVGGSKPTWEEQAEETVKGVSKPTWGDRWRRPRWRRRKKRQ